MNDVGWQDAENVALKSCERGNVALSSVLPLKPFTFNDSRFTDRWTALPSSLLGPG
jgi:hypothetical protein